MLYVNGIASYFGPPSSSTRYCWTCDQYVAGSIPGQCAVECNPGQVVYTYMCLSPSSINVVSWGGNFRSGVALAVHHRQ